MKNIDQDYEKIERLRTLLSYNILDSPIDDKLESLVQLLALICDSPIGIISLIDEKNQYYLAKTGVAQDKVPREETFCQYTLLQDDIMEIHDARLDDRVKNNRHVNAEEGLRFYAGVNIKSNNGNKIGTVCVADLQPKVLNEEQRAALKLIGRQAMNLLEVFKKNKELSLELKEVIAHKEGELQRQLVQKEAQYNLLLRAIRKSNAVVEFSPEGMIKSVNDNFLKMMGYEREELLGQHHSIFLNDDQKENSEEFWNVLKSGKFHAGRLRRKHKDGSLVWVQATYNPISNDRNQVIKILKIAQDITKEIETEKALKRSKELAEELNKQKDYFIANISHEIRTPIHAVLGFTELLLEQEKDPSKKSYLDSIKTAGDNLLYIINDILDLSKIEAGLIYLEKLPFNLAAVIRNVFSILHLKAHQKKILFEYHIDPSVPHNLIGDKNRLAQILINLLGNAIKFTPAGKVNLLVEQICAEKGTSELRFKVIDTGIGIPAAKKDVIFDRFSQAEEDTSRNYGGSGLGLNISQQLVEKLGGKISVESEEGKGSVFVVDLGFQVHELEVTEDKSTQLLDSVTKGKGRILLCEDNELNQRLIKAILSERGYILDLAENGQKGVDLFRNNSYDLVLMDLQMPIMDGYQATEMIRKKDISVPIVALTANFILAEKIKCLQWGMNDYLSKPFAKEDLINLVHSFVKESPKKRVQNLKNGEVVPELVDLKMLQQLSSGDEDFQNEMLTSFMEQSQKTLLEIKELYKANNLSQLKSVAHRLKSSFGIVGAELGNLQALENLAGNPGNSKEIWKKIGSLERQLLKIFSKLNEFINAPQDEDATY